MTCCSTAGNFAIWVPCWQYLRHGHESGHPSSSSSSSSLGDDLIWWSTTRKIGIWIGLALSLVLNAKYAESPNWLIRHTMKIVKQSSPALIIETSKVSIISILNCLMWIKDETLKYLSCCHVLQKSKFSAQNSIQIFFLSLLERVESRPKALAQQGGVHTTSFIAKLHCLPQLQLCK